MASAIGQQDSINKLYTRNPEIARIIKYKDEEQMLTPQMIQEIKEYKEAHQAHKFLNAAGRTGFGAYRRCSNNFNPSFGGSNFNNRNYGNNYNNNNSFFRAGGEDTHRHALSPKKLPAEFPKKLQTKQERKRIWSKNQLRSVMDQEIFWTYYQKKKRIQKYLKHWQFIGGRSLVWYGIMSNFINKERAIVYFRQHKNIQNTEEVQSYRRYTTKNFRI
jgi:hypothetical protein